MSFEQWMTKVDDLVWSKVGCSVHDLPDAPFRDWYEDEMSAKRAANKAIKGNW